MAIKQAPPEPDLPNIRRHLRARPLARLLGWGSAATVALAAVALTSQSEDGRQRLQMAIAYVSAPVRAVAQLPPASLQAEANTQHLAAQLSELAADRERLTARIAVLERSLEDMTGSIKQQNERLPAAQAASSPPPAPAPVATTFPSLPPLAMPAIGEATPGWQIAGKPPETAEVAQPPPTEAAPPPKALEPAAPPPQTVAPRPADEPGPQAAAPLPEPVPLPPVRVAAVPSEPVVPSKPEYGIDLGSAASLEALRVHWAAVKANYGPLLVGLRPLAAAHPRRPSGVNYRLVAGPLPNVAEAAQLCARFPPTRTGCRPAKFIGAQLAEH